MVTQQSPGQHTGDMFMFLLTCSGEGRIFYSWLDSIFKYQCNQVNISPKNQLFI